jgi:hypothetical protein
LNDLLVPAAAIWIPVDLDVFTLSSLRIRRPAAGAKPGPLPPIVPLAPRAVFTDYLRNSLRSAKNKSPLGEQRRPHSRTFSNLAA